MSDVPTIAIYMTDDGPVNVDDLTREQAIQALKETGRSLYSMQESGRRLAELHTMRSRLRV